MASSSNEEAMAATNAPATGEEEPSSPHEGAQGPRRSHQGISAAELPSLQKFASAALLPHLPPNAIKYDFMFDAKAPYTPSVLTDDILRLLGILRRHLRPHGLVARSDQH